LRVVFGLFVVVCCCCCFVSNTYNKNKDVDKELKKEDIAKPSKTVIDSWKKKRKGALILFCSFVVFVVKSVLSISYGLFDGWNARLHCSRSVFATRIWKGCLKKPKKKQKKLIFFCFSRKLIGGVWE
jgi:hypothetical protein